MVKTHKDLNLFLFSLSVSLGFTVFLSVSLSHTHTHTHTHKKKCMLRAPTKLWGPYTPPSFYSAIVMSWVPHQSYIMVAKRAKQGIKGSLPSWASPPLVLHTVKYTNLTCTIQRMYHITNIPIKRKYSHNSSKLLVSSSTQKITMVLTGSHYSGLFFHGLLLPAFEIHINGFIQGVFICVRTLSLNIIILRFIHVIDSMHHLFFF